MVSDDTANRVKKNLAYDRAQRGEFFSQLPTNFLTSTKESFNKMLELPRNLVDPSKNWRDVADSTKGTLNIAGTVYGGVKLVSGFAKAGTSIAKTSTSIFDNMGWQPATVGGYGSNISGWGNLKAAVSSAGKDVGAASLLNMSKLKSTDSASANLNKMQGLVDKSAGNTLSNPFPTNGKFASVMPSKFAEQLIKGEGKLSGGSEAWITAADDLKGINTIKGAANRLTLVDEAGNLRLQGNAVIEFELKDMSGIASPYNRLNPGFINGGRTGGGAREWVIPSDAQIINAKIRYLEK